MADSDLHLSIDLIPNDELAALAKGESIDALVGQSRDRAVIDISVELKERADADKAAVKAAMATASAAAKLIEEHGTDAKLTPEQNAALDLFVLLTARPSLFVKGGIVPDRPDNWPQLGERSGEIEQRIAGVGRIEMSPGGARNATGTGFLVGDRRVMTNNHVVAALARSNPQTWKSEPVRYAADVEEANDEWADAAHRPTFNLLGEIDSDAAKATKITRVVAHHPEVDLAVLEIEDVPEGGKTLKLANGQPDPIRGRDIYVLGYPVAARLESEGLIGRIFGGVDALGTKRCSPGKTIGRVDGNLHHDASTLGGSSGSAVVDFELDAVIALHFAGKAREANRAVPLWSLRNDPLLVDNGVVFG